MIRAALTAALAAASLAIAPGVASAATSATGEPEVDVRVVKSQVTLGPYGGAYVKVRIRCDAPLDVYEVDPSIQQGTSYAVETIPQGGFPVCDGRWHGQRIYLPLVAGPPLQHGPARVSVFVGVYNPITTTDQDVEIQVNVRL